MKPGRVLLIRMVCLLGLILLSRSATFAQTELSGYQNSYMKVLELRPCLITVDGVAVEKGDTIIIMQMGGARLNADGTLLAIGKAGHWQLNVVGGDPDYAAGTIPLKQQLVGYPDSFDISQGIQVIKLPRVSGDAVITEALLGKPWDGGSGGVIALKVPGTLTLRADIIADALGYGQDFRTLPPGRNASTCAASDDNSLRGEGFGNTNNRTGSGPWGNGGGGGPSHNGGGGGGGNFGAGGKGGNTMERPTCRVDQSRVAAGGVAYSTYENLPQAHLIMGGGGGAGHQNNGTGTDGGRGGGIILIIADKIQSSGSFTMSANGDSARSAGLPVAGSAISDGAGGGGAGGTIALYANTVGSGIRFVARGGKGGNVYGTERAGPGGGGGGGAVLSRNPIPAGSFDLAGGAPGGEYAYLNTAWRATAGSAGGTKSGLGQPITGVGEISQLRFSTDGPLEFCRGGSVTLRVENGSSPATWKKMEEPSRSFPQGSSLTVTESGTYTAYTVVGSCELSGSKKVTVWDPPRFDIGAIKTLHPICLQPIPLGVQTAVGGTPPYTYLWETDDEEAIPADQRDIPRPLATFTRDTKVKITVTDAHDCKYVEEYTYQFVPELKYKAPDVTTCQSEPVKIGTDPVGGKELITYAWTPADQLDDATLRQPTVINPTANQRFIVKITDFNGCAILDTVDVTVRPQPKTSISQNAVICPSATTQLVATGGKSYLWEPAEGLSCTTCANPIARPSVTTTYRVRITDAGGCVKTDSVTVTVRTPKLSGDLASLDFGTLDECQTSTTREFTLRNDDDTEIEITEQNFSAPGYSVISPGLPVTIKPHESVKVVIRFAPSAPGPAPSQLTLKGICDASYSIDLTGQQQSTLVSANVGGVNFGQALSCEATPRDTTIVISNTGTAPLDLDAPVIGTPFQVLYPAGARTLPPADTAHYIVRYTPAGAGNFNATLTIPYTAVSCKGTIEVTLNATNVKPSAAADLAQIAFEELVGCNLLADSSVVITNNGTVPVNVRLLDIGAGFKTTSALPVTILPGENSRIGVRFEPIAQGATSGRIRLLYGDCNDTIVVQLNGSSQGVSFAMADSLHFGELVFCNEQSKTMSLEITNTSAGDATSTIESVRVQGPFTTSITPGTTLPNNAPQSFNVVFSPTNDGELTGSIELTLQPCGVTRVIQLDGSRIDGALAVAGAPAVSFGTVPQTQTTTQTLRYRNTGSAPLTNVTISGITAPFALVSSTPALPATLAPGEELELVVSYTGTSGLQNATVRAETELPCRLVAEITLEGRGGLSATTVWIEDFAAAPGERVQVPLLAEGTGELGGLGVTSLKATVRYNRSLLIPAAKAGITEVSRLPVAGDESQIDYTFTAPFQAGSPVATLEFIAALGETMAPTPVRIQSFEWVNHPEITVATRNATFTLEDVCVTGDTRVIRSSGEVVLKPVRPNPVNTTMELEYEIVEDGPTELFISDMLGRRVAVLVSGEAKAGRYVMTVDATKLSSGTYIYVLQTPTERLSRLMEVVK